MVFSLYDDNSSHVTNIKTSNTVNIMRQLTYDAPEPLTGLVRSLEAHEVIELTRKQR